MRTADGYIPVPSLLATARVLTPDQCVELARTQSLALLPLVAGLELFATKALPRINKTSPFST